MFRKFLASSLLASGLCIASPALASQPDIDAQRSHAEAVLDQLRAEAPSAQATWSDHLPAPTLVTGILLSVPGETPRDRADAFLSRYAELAGVTFAELEHVATDTAAGRTSVRYEQRVDGMPVHGAQVIVVLGEAGRVLSLSSSAVAVSDVQRGDVTAAEARTLAFDAVHPDAPHVQPVRPQGPSASGGALSAETVAAFVEDTTRAQAVIVADAATAILAWEVHVLSHPLLRNATVLVDSRDGRVISIRNNVID